MEQRYAQVPWHGMATQCIFLSGEVGEYNGSGCQAYGTYATCRELKDEKEAHVKSVLLDTAGLMKSALRAVTPHLRKQWRGLLKRKW